MDPRNEAGSSDFHQSCGEDGRQGVSRHDHQVRRAAPMSLRQAARDFLIAAEASPRLLLEDLRPNPFSTMDEIFRAYRIPAYLLTMTRRP